MNLDLLLALSAYAFATSITPGPNNLMLMTSGANFGFRRSVPHMFGIAIGFTVMVVLVGSGLAQLFARYPASHTILQALSVAYLLWLAWKFAHAAPLDDTDTPAAPLNFLQAAAFQWVNPKAWAMAVTATTIYAPDRSLAAILVVALVFGAINLPSVSIWAALGQQVARFLTSNARLAAFNWTMAVLLVLSLYPVLRPG